VESQGGEKWRTFGYSLPCGVLAIKIGGLVEVHPNKEVWANELFSNLKQICVR
jgi:hypothetical protein